ncbi:NADH:ubiquinone oxidoreductase subunit NDUFA12 [Sphingomonas lacunae]|uniref:NADH:ubiquinone oxidoreductase subunit NDUFA12 n=1 Tax=Sphingomonas lacunae TaxID=2698828 RepID=A0A6M4AQ48_9SPHN|nr:NADH:ubiquinone oxidoreductase subunit NDUFA12 [Sphingomonas lacunae]QJQ31148.1 NADH:ubiquinone oxidoreductase subunit NDUFA12 [Sphingomonas lacunae]
MGILSKIFTWWDGATIGTLLFSARKGTKVGEDSLGNRYFASRDGSRRWVIYQGSNDASRVPPEWHGWLHHTHEDLPDSLPPVRDWQAEPTPNLTGTVAAYRPAGSLERGGKRAPASGDYQAWTPDAA